RAWHCGCGGSRSALSRPGTWYFWSVPSCSSSSWRDRCPTIETGGVAEADPEPRAWPAARLLAQLYDLEHDEFTADADLYISLAQRTGGPILEVACGTGRILAPLARRGLSVVGFDSSPDMLARASRRL